MTKFNKYISSAFAALAASCVALTPACTDDLDQYPHIETTSQSLYKTVGDYESVLAKLYALYSIAGQEKGGGNADLSSNTGFDFMRCLFNLQEMATDEVVGTWLEGDKLTDLTYFSWDANDPWVADVYFRLYYNIALCNEFLRHSSDDALASFSQEDQATLRAYRAEARYLRAQAYVYVLDLYRKGPMVTEADLVGAYVPAVADAQGIFDYVESELQACAQDMAPRTQAVYGRAPRAAAWMLLSRLYLNAKVYTGTERYSDCVAVTKKVIDEGYVLNDDYAALFNADNHLRTNEIIFHVVVDATETVSWGTTTYLVCGAVSSTKATAGYSAANYGVQAAWGSMRSRGQLTQLFDEKDSRALFFADEQQQSVAEPTDQAQGWLVTKWTNLTDAGEAASNTSSDGVCTDYPMYRLAEAYLNMAEAVVRGGQGASKAEALEGLNKLRERAGLAHMFESDMSLEYILAERGRELYWEMLRRTDLIRFGMFTTADYLWDLKHGAVADKYNYYPIPQADLTANPNLSNPEY